MHHFNSFCNILYWQRYIDQKDAHEIDQGTIQNFSPFVCFFKGNSIFHHFAADIKLLTTVTDCIEDKSSKDPVLKMIPSLFLHSNPMLNPIGKKTTPIHIAIDKQSPMAFETMFKMLIDSPKLCITSQLLDVLEYIIENDSETVLDFFNNSFYVTDQFSGLHALLWEDESVDDMIIALPTAYISSEFIQAFVGGSKAEELEHPAN